jgi:hypothetical protein
MSRRTLDDDLNSFMNDPIPSDSEFDLRDGGTRAMKLITQIRGNDHVDTPSGQPVGRKRWAESVSP